MYTIAILNESFLSNEHLAQLRSVGNVTVYTNTTTEDEIIERLAGADIAIGDCFLAPFTARVFEHTPSLKFLTINSTGFDAVDIAAAHQNGVIVSNVPDFGRESVAELAIGLLLAVARHIPAADRLARTTANGTDPVRREQNTLVGFDLKGKTMGIIGYGSIGSRIAELAGAFGMNVIVYSVPTPTDSPYTLASLPELLSASDVVSICVPLNEHTEAMIGAAEFATMKPSAVLINIARGKVVHEPSLVAALQTKQIASAGLDVLADWSPQNPLLTMDNVVITPHAAWKTHDSMHNIADIVTQNVLAFASGAPQNAV